MVPEQSTSEQPRSILEADGLTVRFGGIVALDDVSFAVRGGSIHAMIGPNGAGKSTCFNALTALYPLASGEVHFQGARLDTLPQREIITRGVSRTFQNLVLPPQLTVAQTLRVGRHHRTRTGMLAAALALPSARREEAEDERVVHTMAEMMDIEELLHEPVGPLPYGIRKKVEIARALCAEPSMLLLDEPVAGMNESESRLLGEQIRACRERFDLTILLVEHDMELVLNLSDHITVLQSGRVIADDAPEVVQRDPAVIAAYLGSDAEPHAVKGAGARG